MNKRVLLVQQRQWGLGIGHELAKRFHRDGCRLAAFTAKKTTDTFTREQADVPYELILSHDEIKDSCDDAQVSLQAICEDIGEGSIWPFVYTVRNAVYSYGDKFYYSFRQNMSDDDIIEYIKRIYIDVRKALENFRPDVVVMPNTVSLFQIMVAFMAKRRGSMIISFTDSKVSGFTIISHSPFLQDGPFIDRVKELNSGSASRNQARAKEYIDAFRERLIQPAYMKTADERPTLIQRLKQELIPYLQIARFMLGKDRANYVESFGITVDWRPPRIILRDHYQKKSYRRAALARQYDDLGNIGPFVYMPLQMQPEAQIDMLAVQFANQIESARQTALALPGDYTLVVKEHPSMIARRPPSYHDKLSRLANVKLLDPRVPTSEVLKRCALVVSAGGTTLAEAAFYGKPGIQLGQHGTTMALPNVIHHTDMSTLCGAIQRALAQGDYTSGEYEHKLRNYVAAAFDTGLELNFSRVWYEGGTSEEYDMIYNKIVEVVKTARSRSLDLGPMVS